MKKTTILALFVMMLVALSFTVLAQAQDKNETENEVAKQNRNSEINMTNMTYGQCVSFATVAKKTCYSDVKTSKFECLDSAKLNNATKDVYKTCKKDYALEKKTCKKDFKAEKVECKRVKAANREAKIKSE